MISIIVHLNELPKNVKRVEEVFANYCNIDGKLNPDGDEMECTIDITTGTVKGLMKI
jgi:hypothetical protein